MAENPRESNELIESLAALEHEQWIAWSKAVAPEVSEDRRKRWETYWVPYNDLDEDVKEKDREWARKVAEIIAPDNGGLNAPTTGVGPGRDLTLRLDVDVSDALTGLKALRREADKAARAMRELAEELERIEEARRLASGTIDELQIGGPSKFDVTSAQEYRLASDTSVLIDDGVNPPIRLEGPARLIVVDEE